MENMHFHNMVSDGGNGITIEDQLIGIEPLNFEDCIALIEECQEKNIPWAFSPDNKVRRLAPDDRFYEATHDFYMKTKRVEHLNPRDYDQIYKVYIAIEKEDENKLKTLNLVPWVRFHKEYIFVEPSDKAKGIRKMV